MARFKSQRNFHNQKRKAQNQTQDLLALFKSHPSIYVYQVQNERHEDFKRELKNSELALIEDCFFCDHEQGYLWPINSWGPLFISEIPSISKAASFLKYLQRNWVHQPLGAIRRGELIAQELPKISAKPLVFPASVPKTPLGVFSLIDNEHMIYSQESVSPFVRAIPRFSNVLTEAPSQAYFKLWEGLSRIGVWPSSRERVLDVGSSPGSWTLALSKIAESVLSVDKAALDEAVLNSKNVEHLKADAFKIPDKIFKEVDWLFSDIICTPDKLFEFIERALKLNSQLKMLCTIKFMGKWDPASVEKFSKIPNSKILHLFYNKHELTFIRIL